VALQDLSRVVGYLAAGDQLHLAHNFVFAHLPWDADAFRTAITDFEALADQAAWPAWFLSNHDIPRVATRFGARRARAAALILYALRGTPFLYQGEELGLPDAAIPPDRVVDVDGRDPQRAPMPWRPGPGAGFTRGEPWLPLVAEAERLNVERQASDPASMLSFVRRLAALRAETPALQAGAQRTLDAGPDVLAWERTGGGERLLVAVNFGDAPRPLPFDGELLLSTQPARGAAGELAGSEGVIIRAGRR